LRQVESASPSGQWHRERICDNNRIAKGIATTPLEWSRRPSEHLELALVRHCPEEATMVEVGDRVLVESEKVGSATRSGVVSAVDGQLITVRWDSGSESVFVPSAGSLQVTGHESPGREAASS
jgi:Domain of unknown function (DUF1918)